MIDIYIYIYIYVCCSNKTGRSLICNTQIAQSAKTRKKKGLHEEKTKQRQRN